MSITRERLSSAVKDAMRAGEKFRLGVLRLAMAEIKRREVDDRVAPDDATVITLLTRMVKQRRESIAQFTAGNRPELAAREQEEIEILQEFMPKALSNDEINALIEAALAETNATSIRQMGAVMAVLKDKIAGAADLSAVSALVKARLG